MANPISYVNRAQIAFPAPVPAPKETLCKRVGKGLTAPFRVTLKVLNTSVENTSALDKTGKFLISILRLVSDIALHIFKVSFIPLKMVITEVGAMVGLISGLNFISRAKEWTTKTNGKPFWDPSVNSPDKVRSRALLTTAHAIEAGLFFKTMGLINFGKFVTFLGSIPILGLIVRVPVKVVKDLFVVGSSVFGIKASLQSYSKAKKRLKEPHRHVVKWQDRLDQMAAARTDNAKDRILKTYFDELFERNGRLHNALGELLNSKDAEKAALLDTVADVAKVDNRDQLFAAHKVRAELKLKHWQKIEKETAPENMRRTKIRTVMALAYDVSKISIISMVIIGMFTGLSAMVPYLLATGVVGLISNSLGWGKVLADEYNKAVKNPAVPKAAMHIEYHKDAKGKIVKDADGKPVIASRQDYFSKYTYYQAVQPGVVFA